MSQSIDGGVSIVTVQFFVGESVEDSKIKMTQKVYGNMDVSPVGISQPLIKELNPDDVPVLALALSSETLSKATLRKLALDVKSELAHVENTTNIRVH
jgi:multidrug efflux pump subunit AcrB